MKIISKVFTFRVKQKEEETKEDVYVRAMKQMLKMNVVEFNGYIPTFQVRRLKDNAIEIEMFLTFDSKEIDYRLCDICQEISGSFYMPGQSNCRDCKYKAWVNRMEEKIKKVSYYGKGQIEMKKKWG